MQKLQNLPKNNHYKLSTDDTDQYSVLFPYLTKILSLKSEKAYLRNFQKIQSASLTRSANDFVMIESIQTFYWHIKIYNKKAENENLQQK